MTDFIEREAALNASKIVYIEYIEVDGEGYEDGNADNIPVVFKKDIEAIPAADVRPVVRGKWVLDCGGVKCTACGEYPEKKDQCYTPFCCLCGADMREVDDA